MERLQLIINKIENDKRFLLSVQDMQTGAYVCKYKPAQSILAEYGTAVNFFEDLFAKGHKSICISQHRKNGTGKLKDGETFNFRFEDKNNDPNESNNEATEPSENQPIQPQPPMYQPQPPMYQPQQQFGGDIMAQFGLNAPQVIDLFIQKTEAERFKLENAELKLKNAALEESNTKLREKELEDRYNWDKEKDRKSNNSELIGQLTGALPAVLEYLKPKENTGLNAPVDFGTPQKTAFAEQIRNLDNDTFNVINTVLMLSQTNQAFATDLINIIQKNQTPAQ